MSKVIKNVDIRVDYCKLLQSMVEDYSSVFVYRMDNKKRLFRTAVFISLIEFVVGLCIKSYLNLNTTSMVFVLTVVFFACSILASVLCLFNKPMLTPLWQVPYLDLIRMKELIVNARNVKTQSEAWDILLRMNEDFNVSICETFDLLKMYKKHKCRTLYSSQHLIVVSLDDLYEESVVRMLPCDDGVDIDTVVITINYINPFNMYENDVTIVTEGVL